MIKNNVCSVKVSLFSLLIICFLTFYFGNNSSAQEGNPLQYKSDGKDESEVKNPSPKKLY